MSQKSLEAAQVIQILTNTLDVMCCDELDNFETYATKQKIIDKISHLIDTIDGD